MIVTIVTIAIVTLFEGAVSEIDLTFVDESVDPCEDFYQFSCGNFKKFHSRQENQSTVDLFTITQDQLLEIGIDILSSAKQFRDPVALKKAKAAYKACVEVADVDDLTYYQFPEKRILDQYGGLPLVDPQAQEKISFSQIAQIAGTFGIHQLFTFVVKNFSPEDYILIMFPDTMDKPEMFRPQTIKTYDEVVDESLKKLGKMGLRSGNQEDPLDVFVKKVARYLGSQKPESILNKDIEEMKTFMTQLSDGGIIDDDYIPLDDVVTIGELQAWTEKQFGDEIDIDWTVFFQQQFKWANIEITDNFTVYLVLPDVVYGTLNLVRKTDPKVVKNFILLRTLLFMAPDSVKPIRDAFEVLYKAWGSQYYDRSEYCARKILDVVDSASLSFAVAYDFSNYHFDINKIPKAVEVIENTRQAFRDILITLNWVDQESRDAVFAKLNNIVVFLGFPDFVDDKSTLDKFYENVRICEWDNYANAQKIRAFKQAYSFNQFLNYDLWLNSPFEVNAYAIRANNRIMAPLAMLQDVYFYGHDPVYDYSRFGSIIAHEFIHHFDKSGVGYNSEGLQTSLLTNNTKDSLQTKVQCFADQYSKFYVPEIKAYINGTATLDENTADNGGLRHAFLAFRKVIRERHWENKKSRYTLDQQFFISYAAQWCSDDSDDYLTQLVSGNSHPPNRYRVLGTLSNMKEFARAFNCPVGSNMNPKNKCVLW